MTPKDPLTPIQLHPDDAPDLSTPDWQAKFSKVLLASGSLEGVDLELPRDFGRDVQLIDDAAPLWTEEEYQAALREIERHFREEPVPGTPEASRFDQLAEQIRVYESAHWPISSLDQDA
jgi:hypothetical protein